MSIKRGKQDPLSIDCYARAGIVLGGACDEATVRFFDPDVFRETGETVYLPVLSSEATEQRVMIGAGVAKSVADWRLVHHVNISTARVNVCLLYTSPSPRDGLLSRMPSSA